jgi:hypothetical protein
MNKNILMIKDSMLFILIKFWLVFTILFISSCEVPFKANFEVITGEKFIEEMVINYEESTPQDAFGDYSSIMVVKVGFDFYNSLPQKLFKKQFKIVEKVNFGEFEKTKGNIKFVNIIKQYEFRGNDVYYTVGFLSDKESIVLIYSSW